jgi:dTMP kinase
VNDGRVVVSDRFLDSSLAYQGEARGLGLEEVRRINAFATGGLTPDITFLLEVEPATAAARAGDGEDRFEREGSGLQERVAVAYDRLAAEEPQRWQRVPADRDPDAVHADILAVVEAVLAGAPA